MISTGPGIASFSNRENVMPTSSFRQVTAVLGTYASWWFTWLVLVLSIAGLVLVLAGNPGLGIASSSVGVEFTGQTWDHLRNDLTRVDGIVLNQLVLNEALKPDSPLRMPGWLPNLRRLNVFSGVSESQLINLLEYQQLRSLLLVHLDPLTDRGFGQLSTDSRWKSCRSCRSIAACG